MSTDIERLRQVAEAAAAGPWWRVPGESGADAVLSGIGESLTWDDHGGEVFKPADAEHIAAFDPPTVLALLDEVERLRGQVARAEGRPDAREWAAVLHLKREMTSGSTESVRGAQIETCDDEGGK